MTNECPNCGFQLTATNLKRATRLPSDWQPTPAQLAWARNERRDVDPRKAADMFRDYWVAKSGKGATKLDWDATWRNWIRNTQSTPAVAVLPIPASFDRAISTKRDISPEQREANRLKIAELAKTVSTPVLP